MDLMIVTNSRFLKYAVVMLNSLFCSNEGEARVFMPYEDLTDEEVDKLKMFVEEFPGKSFYPLYVGTDFKNMVQSRSGIMVETYYRIIGWGMLPEDCHRILYLDVDMIVKGSLEGLFNIDMQGKLFAVCEDIFGKINCFHEANKRRLGLGENDSYFNAGMILADVDQLREGNEVQKILDNVYRDYERYEYNDQDVLNEMYHDRLLYVGWDQFNMPPSWYYMDNEKAQAGELYFANYDDIRRDGADADAFSKKYTNITAQLARSCVIMHYLADTKPWDSRRKPGNVYDIFDKYYYPEEERALDFYRDIVGECLWYSSAPVLIIYGVTYCYNILNDILHGLEKALNRAGIRTIAYNEQEGDIAGLLEYDGKTFSAIIGIQTYLFGVYLEDRKQYLIDRLNGPKFNIITDHPIWLRNIITQASPDVWFLTHDENYVRFMSSFYGRGRSFVWPPAAHEVDGDVAEYKPIAERKYDISFIGTYGDYREKLKFLDEIEEGQARLARQFYDKMISDPNLTAEIALMSVLEDNGYKTSPDEEDAIPDEQILDTLDACKPMIQAAMYYYREKTIEALLSSGLEVNIWGESWKNYSLEGVDEDKRANLVIHADVTPDEAYSIMCDSKISLNIMAWHKAGFTERIASSMMAGCVVVSDKTDFGGLRTNENIMMFDLADELDVLPEVVKKLLADDKKLNRISLNARDFASEYHTWDARVRELFD